MKLFDNADVLTEQLTRLDNIGKANTKIETR